MVSRCSATVDPNLYATTQDKFVDLDCREQRQATRGEPDLLWSPDAVLVDTFERRGVGIYTPTQTDNIHVY